MSGAVDGDSQGGPTVVNTFGIEIIQRPVHARRVNPARFGQIKDSKSGSDYDLHTKKHRIFCDKVKGQYRMVGEIAENAIFPHSSEMGKPRSSEISDVWPKRARFVELLDQKLEMATYEEIAVALGLKSTRSLEHEWRYDKSRRPGRKTLELAAPYMGVDIWEIDGPDGDEDFGNIMGILGRNLTPESRAAMIEMAKAAQVKGRERLEAEKKAKNGNG